MKSIAIILAAVFAVSVVAVDADAWGKRKKRSSWGFSKKKKSSSSWFKKKKAQKRQAKKKNIAKTKKNRVAIATKDGKIKTKTPTSRKLSNKLSTNKANGTVSSKPTYTRTVTRVEYRQLPARSSGFSDFLTGALVGAGAYYLFFDRDTGQRVDYGFCEANPDQCRAEKKQEHEVEVSKAPKGVDENGVINDFATGDSL